ncbi:hypothetical protein H3N56_02600 [Cetobacterium sp. 2A]|uniref:hypothetical protein n=1 Tax=Cetobacterium sp. 2A TaxID=2754723 RepID=UPI00163BD17A|nr:hypothetical protein [Cetobacterium sp. 2A]MBC2855383.1 hypothetical protein [Cetobacterium sp. 2A]
MPKKYYNANDAIYVDGINKIIHLKDRNGENCVLPPLKPSVVFSSYVDLLNYYLGTDHILCPHCFANLTFDNFKKVHGFNFDNCKSRSYNNQENRLKILNKQS